VESIFCVRTRLCPHWVAFGFAELTSFGCNTAQNIAEFVILRIVEEGLKAKVSVRMLLRLSRSILEALPVQTVNNLWIIGI
jgi:hypothetical protein